MGHSDVRRGRERIDLADLVVMVGLALLAGGLGAYDWRLAAVVLGVLLVVLGLAGAVRR